MKKSNDDFDLITAMWTTNRQLLVIYRNQADPKCAGEAFILTPHDFSEAEVRSMVRVALRNLGMDVEDPRAELVVEGQTNLAIDILTGDALDADPAD